MIIKNFGISKKFRTDFNQDELLKENGMSVQNIVNEVKKHL